MAWWQRGGGDVRVGGREESLQRREEVEGWEGSSEGARRRRERESRRVSGEGEEGQPSPENSPVRSHIF